jgi:hypothetical protein
MLLAACSGIRFSNVDDGKSHPYRVASPAMKIVTAPDCTMTAEVITIPGRLNYLKFQTGLGKINDTVEFEPGGTIKKISASQEGVAEDLGKVVGAVTSAVTTAVKPLRSDFNAMKAEPPCQASAQIYPVKLDPGGNPYVDYEHPMLQARAAEAK